jgi:hypothetical protein
LRKNQSLEVEIGRRKYLLEEIIGNPIVVTERNAVINVDSASD